MNALRRQNIRPQQTFERWTPRTHETPRELARQSETKRKQAVQSEANVCRRRRKCNLKINSLINFTGHPIRHRTPNTILGLHSRTSNAISLRSSPVTFPTIFGQLKFIPLPRKKNTTTIIIIIIIIIIRRRRRRRRRKWTMPDFCVRQSLGNRIPYVSLHDVWDL